MTTPSSALSLSPPRCRSRTRRACSSAGWNFASGRWTNKGLLKEHQEENALPARPAILLAVIFVLLGGVAPARAQLSIEITGGGAQRIPIAVVPFPGENALAAGGAAGLTPIIRADLERSGLFRGLEVPPLSPPPTEATLMNYAEWRSRLADAVVLGSVVP